MNRWVTLGLSQVRKPGDLFFCPPSSPTGFTIVEFLVGMALLVGGSGALLMSMEYSNGYTAYLREVQLAMNKVYGRIEQLAASSFDTLWTGPEFHQARGGTQGETVSGLQNGRLAIQIRGADPENPGDPELLDIHISACWRSHNNRFIGEDRNCNGFMDPGEDVNGNGWLDSPAMVSTRIAQRDDS